MNPAKNADEPTFGQGFVTRLKNNLVWVGGAALVSAGIIFLVPAAVMTSPIVVVGTGAAAAYGGYQTGLAAHQLRTGAEVNQLGVPTGRQLTPAELGEKAADVTAGVVVTGAGAAGALRGRWAAQAVAGAEAEAAIAALAGPGATRTWLSRLPWRKAPSKPGPEGNKPPANPSEPASYGGEHPEPWTPPPGPSQPGGSAGAGSGTGAGAGSNAGVASNKAPHFSKTDKPWTSGATPNSTYTHIGPDGKAIQNAIYDSNGNVVGHVDFKNHGPGSPSGHGHQFPVPGVPASGHGPGKPHIPASQLPPGWLDLPPGVAPRAPIGQ